MNRLAIPSYCYLWSENIPKYVKCLLYGFVYYGVMMNRLARTNRSDYV